MQRSQISLFGSETYSMPSHSHNLHHSLQANHIWVFDAADPYPFWSQMAAPAYSPCAILGGADHTGKFGKGLSWPLCQHNLMTGSTSLEVNLLARVRERWEVHLCAWSVSLVVPHRSYANYSNYTDLSRVLFAVEGDWVKKLGRLAQNEGDMLRNNLWFVVSLWQLLKDAGFPLSFALEIWKSVNLPPESQRKPPESTQQYDHVAKAW